jgi:hypothetical protein
MSLTWSAAARRRAARIHVSHDGHVLSVSRAKAPIARRESRAFPIVDLFDRCRRALNDWRELAARLVDNLSRPAAFGLLF